MIKKCVYILFIVFFLFFNIINVNVVYADRGSLTQETDTGGSRAAGTANRR